MTHHKRDEWGYVEIDCDCEECYYYRLSYEYDTWNVGYWMFEKPGFAFVSREEDLPSTEEAVYDEALLVLTGEETWKGGRTVRLDRIKVGRRYPMRGEPGEVFLIAVS